MDKEYCCPMIGIFIRIQKILNGILKIYFGIDLKNKLTVFNNARHG
jgi:hypothetical protein